MEVITAYFVLFFILLISQILTLFLVIGMRRKAKANPDTYMRETQAKTRGIIYKAVQEANKILVAAELKGLQLIGKQKMTSEDLAGEFDTHLSAIEKAIEDQLEHSAKHADETYEEFVRAAETSINAHITNNQKMLEEKANTMIERAESLLTEFTGNLEAKVKGDVERELAQVARELVEYKANRIRIIDERIVDILEEVIRVTLGKKISLADQSDLVYKALDDAKKEHSFNKS
jgi:hypothetical protein